MILVADHGEMFPLDGHRGGGEDPDEGPPLSEGHGHALYGELMQVPLIIRTPEGLGHERRVEVLTSHVDLYVTVGDLLGLDLPPVSGDQVSLAPWLAAEAPSALRGRAHVLLGGSHSRPEPRGIRTRKLKLIEYHGDRGSPSEHLVSQLTEFHADSDRWTSLDRSDPDGLGHFRYEVHDASGDWPGASVRTTFTNFNPGRDLVLDSDYYVEEGYAMVPTSFSWILETYADRTVIADGSVMKSQYCFDAPTSQQPTATGFLERVRILEGSVPGIHDLLQRFTPDAHGNVEREEYFGGDLQNLSTSANLCGLSLPANQYEIEHTYDAGVLSTSNYVDEHGPMSFRTVDRTIDPSTGLVAESRDSAGIETAYGWDSMGRLRWVKRADGAWTEYVYTRATSASSPAKVTIIQRPNGSTTGVLAQEEVIFDHFGRVWKERRWQGIGWTGREALYDARGLRTRISDPEELTCHNRSFLIDETHPEKGLDGNGRVKYFDFDTRGHLGARSTAPTTGEKASSGRPIATSTTSRSRPRSRPGR